MTVCVPLDGAPAPAPAPAFLVAPADPDGQLALVVKAILKARRVVVVCGAGISVQAGIPDFRSSDGLFQTLKRDNPREALSSGRDLFDASVFNSEHTTALFCQMIAGLSELSDAAQPTPFHQLLRALDVRGKLLRVYTQNIDAIEAKAGLSFGVPAFDAKKPRSKGKEPDDTPPATPVRAPTPPADTPRCIPLHGTLQALHCATCTHAVPLAAHRPALAAGTPPPCPACTALAETRALVGKRARGIGRLRPSVVLYNEAHRDAEGVGEAVRRDLVGARRPADLLLVVGTSLRVPGTKRIVREFAKAVRARDAPAGGLPSPAPSPRRSPAAAPDEERVRAVYLNLDFPVPTREWEGVFDVWLQGDAQRFARVLMEAVDAERRAKAAAAARKQVREAEAARVAAAEERARKAAVRKRKGAAGAGPPAKRRRVAAPACTPKSAARARKGAATPAGKTKAPAGKAAASPRKAPARPRVPPPGKRTAQVAQPRLVLRIPARPRLPVPAVVITTAPLLPPTPASAPPRRPGLRSGAPLTPIKSPPLPPARRSRKVLVENEGEGGWLPTDFVRTVQYGLRGS